MSLGLLRTFEERDQNNYEFNLIVLYKFIPIR